VLSLSGSCKIVFFDRNIIRRNWKNINETPLKKAGLLVRKIARGSIRRVSPTNLNPSPAGTPPRSRSPGGEFKLIYSVPSWDGGSVVVGMVGFGGARPIPGLEEHGGRVQRRVFRNFKKRKKNKKLSSSEINKQYTKRRERRKDRRKNQIKSRLQMPTQMVTYPERPFMRPALRIARPKIPMLYQGVLGGNPIR
jgi:hypothetical protein